MYYKIVSGGVIVDAVKGSLNYVRWQEKNRVVLSCEEADADGIISSNGSDIYLLESAPALDGGFLDFAFFTLLLGLLTHLRQFLGHVLVGEIIVEIVVHFYSY